MMASQRLSRLAGFSIITSAGTLLAVTNYAGSLMAETMGLSQLIML